MRFLVGAGNSIYTIFELDGTIQDEVCFRHPSGKNLKCLSTTEDRKKLLAGFDDGGIFSTEDRGGSWNDITGSLPLTTVSACAMDPEDPKRIYVGTNPPALFLTEDGGGSWIELTAIRQHPNRNVWSAPRGNPQLRTIAISPSDSQMIFVGIEVGDLLRSDDGGENWRVLEGVCHDIHRVVLSASRPGVIFLFTGEDTPPYQGENGLGFFLSENNGRNWRTMNEALITGKRVYCEDAVALVASEPEVLFMAIADGIPPYWKGPSNDSSYFVAPARSKREKGADVSLHRSQDGGLTWELLSGRGGLPGSLFDAVWGLDARKQGDSIVVSFGTTAGEVWRSGDGGKSWTTLERRFPPVSHLALLE